MLSTFVITLREGLEAALIIGIIFAYLAKTRDRQGFRQVWLGTGLAVVVSIIAAIVIYLISGTFEGRTEEAFEGIAMLVAACILTWMIFWMRKQSANIKGRLQNQIDTAFTKGANWGLVGLAFVAVVREGIETVLFLFAATRATDSTILSSSGAFLGFIFAIVIGYGIYKGTSKLNLRFFFNITGLILVVFAAGLLAHGIHELQEAAYIPTVIEHVWDINNIIPEGSNFGRFLTAIFGYNGDPSLIEVIVYSVYLIAILAVYFIPARLNTKAEGLKKE